MLLNKSRAANAPRLSLSLASHPPRSDHRKRHPEPVANVPLGEVLLDVDERARLAAAVDPSLVIEGAVPRPD